MSFSAQKSFRLMPLFFQTSINENINCESVLSGCSIVFFQQNYFANFSNERCSSPDGYAHLEKATFFFKNLERRIVQTRNEEALIKLHSILLASPLMERSSDGSPNGFD